MARFRRKDLKRDRFVEEVTQQVEFFSEHRKQFIAGGVAVVIAIAAAGGYWTYSRHRAATSQAALQDAIDLYHSEVSDEAIPAVKTFATATERLDAVTTALDAVALDFAGTVAAAGASYYSGLLDRQEGKPVEAKSHFEQAIRGKGDEFPSLARLALGNLLLADGDAEAAREHFQMLVENPTRTVTRDLASIQVARTHAESDPQAARSILEPIQAENGPASAMASALIESLAPAEGS